MSAKHHGNSLRAIYSSVADFSVNNPKTVTEYQNFVCSGILIFVKALRSHRWFVLNSDLLIRSDFFGINPSVNDNVPVWVIAV